jgi:hypothetical protein
MVAPTFAQGTEFGSGGGVCVDETDAGVWVEAVVVWTDGVTGLGAAMTG